MSAHNDAQPAALLREISSGLRASQALYVAANLGVADHLAQRPMKSAELGALTGVDSGALHRVMRALCALNVFAESHTGDFSLTSTGQLLRTDIPGSFRAAVLQLVGDVRWRCWADLLGTVRAGGGGAERALGMGLFDFYAAHPQESEIHDQAMQGISASQLPALLDAADLGDSGTVVDVGGGTGELLAAVISIHPELTGVLFDLGHVVAQASRVFDAKGVAGRVRTVGGSFFEAVPADGDTYILKTILHDWDDARATTILRNCRTAMKPASKLVILERVLPELGWPERTVEAFLLDLEMLVMTPGGRERTQGEFQTILSAADFRLVRIMPTRCPLSIIEAVPA